MTNDPREKQQLSYSTSTSKKWQQRKTAMAISMATCLFLGAIGYEIVREKEPLLESPTAKTLLFPQETNYDHDLIVKYNESLQKIQDLKKLLFLQQHAPQNKKVSELQSLLQEKDSRLSLLAQELAAEKEKTNTLDISLSSLADYIELQRSINETTIARMQEERERLQAQNLAEQDLIVANFERHLANQEASVAILKEKLEREKSEALANFEAKWKAEKENVERFAADVEKERQNLMASLEQKFQEQNESIRQLQTQNDSLEDFFSLKEQALQATESAWKDYALDLSEELQVLEKELAIKEEQRFFDDEEIKRLSRKIDQLEKASANSTLFAQSIEKEFDYLGKLYSQLEEKYYIERVLANYQEEPAKVPELGSNEQLAQAAEQYRQEAFVAAEALAIEKKVSDTLFEDMNFYLAQSQEFKEKLSASKRAINELDRSYSQLIEELGSKTAELEDTQHIFALQLAMSNEAAENELELAKASHESALRLVNEILTSERQAKESLEKEIAVLQQHFEGVIAHQEKSYSEILALQEEKEKLYSSLENAEKEFENYKNNQKEELAAAQQAVSQLNIALQEALAKQEQMQLAFNEEKSMQLKEFDAFKQDFALLENQLKDAYAVQEKMRTDIAADKANFLQQLETYKFNTAQLEEKLEGAFARQEEMQARMEEDQAYFNNDKIRLLQEVEAFKLTASYLEKKLQAADEKYDSLMARAAEEKESDDTLKKEWLADLEVQKLAKMELEEKLLEAIAKQAELQLKMEEEMLAFTTAQNAISDQLAEKAQISDKFESQLNEAIAKQEAIQKRLEEEQIAFRSENESKVHEIEGFRAAIAQLESKLSEANLRKEELQLALQDERDSYLQEFDQQLFTLNELEAELKNTYAKLHETESQLFESHLMLQDEKTQFVLEAAAHQQALRQLENRLKDADAIAADFDASKLKIAQLEADLAAAIVRHSEEELAYDAEKAALLQEIDSIKLVSNEYEEKWNSSKIRIEELQARLNDEHSMLIDDKAQLMQEVESYKLVSAHMEKSLSDNQQKLEALNNRLQEEQAEKIASLARLTEIQVQLLEEQGQLANLNNEKMQLLKDLETYKQASEKVAELQARLLEDEISLANLSSEKEKLQKDVEAYKLANEKVLELQTLLLEKQNELTSVSSEKAQLLQDMESYKIIAANLETRLNETHTKIDELQTRLLEERSEYARLNEDKAALMQDSEASKIIAANLAELQVRFSEGQENLVKLTNEVEFYKSITENLEKSLQDTNQKNQELQAKFSEEHTALDAHRVASAKMEEQLKESHLKAEELQAQLNHERLLLSEAVSQKNLTAQLETQLRDAYDKLQARMLEEQVELESYKADLQNEQEAKKLIENALAAVKLDLEEKNSIIDLSLAKEKEAKENIISYQDAIVDTQLLYKKRIEDLKVESSALAIELEKVHDQNVSQKEKFYAEKSQLDAQLAKLKEEISSLTAKDKEYEEALATILLLKEELIARENSYETLNEFLTAQTAKVAFLEKNLEDQLLQNNQITSELSLLKNSIQEKEQLLIELSEREKHLKVEFEEKISAIQKPVAE